MTAEPVRRPGAGAAANPAPVRLAQRRPDVADARLLAVLAPPPRFADVRFDTYRPDPAQPTQAAAVDALRGFAAEVADPAGQGRWWPFGGRRREPEQAGVYLDGGFGVGKTHLLASLWHATPGERAFGTFVEYTNLVGALGFRRAVEGLSAFSLVCIDEFELDDPGDTVLMSRLLRELVDAGVRLAATSNTLPDALGEGRSLVWGGVALNRNLLYRDTRALYEQTVRCAPGHFKAWGVLAEERFSRGDMAGAQDGARRAVGLNPYYPGALRLLRDSSLALGDQAQARDAETIERALFPAAAPY